VVLLGTFGVWGFVAYSYKYVAILVHVYYVARSSSSAQTHLRPRVSITYVYTVYLHFRIRPDCIANRVRVCPLSLCVGALQHGIAATNTWSPAANESRRHSIDITVSVHDHREAPTIQCFIELFNVHDLVVGGLDER
jgi:hypothetical protein